MVKNKLKISKVFYKRNLLFLLPPEVAHSLAIMALKKMPYKNPIELPESLSVNFLVISSEAP